MSSDKSCGPSITSDSVLFAAVLILGAFILYQSIAFYIKQASPHHGPVHITPPSKSTAKNGPKTTKTKSPKSTDAAARASITTGRAVSKSKDVRLIRMSCLTTLFFYSLSIIVFFLSFVVCDINLRLLNIGVTLSCIGMLFVIILFAIRLYFTFNNTQFALKNSFKYYVFIVCIMIFTSHLVNAIINLHKLTNDGSNFAAILGGLTLLFQVINGMLLLLLFISKLNFVIQTCINSFGTLTQTQLNKLNKSLSVSVDGGIDLSYDNSSITDDNVNDLKALTRLISDMSKYTILVGIAMISTMIIAIFVIVLFAILQVNVIYAMLLFMIDNCINCVCLIIQFEFYKKYYIVLCNTCHAKCEDRYTKENDGSGNSKLLSPRTSAIYSKNSRNSGIGSVGSVNNSKNNSGKRDSVLKLKRLASGEIGLIATETIDENGTGGAGGAGAGGDDGDLGDIGTDLPDLDENRMEHHAASLSIPATVPDIVDGVDGGDGGGNGAIAVMHPAIVVAQKSVDMSLL